MTNEDKGTFLTIAEVAEIMRVSKMTVYRLVHAGDMPAAVSYTHLTLPTKA